LLDKEEQTLAQQIPNHPIWVMGDRVRLVQVFANLLNNAAKYSNPGGKVVLSAAQKGAQVSVHVRDTGIGVPAEHLGKIFEPFTQVDRSLDRYQGGLGIGLNLVKHLVELHEGRVAALSDGIGQGTEFVVTLPCEA
jgi:signal transduction histidine kinase